jgi:hypothetical protein
MSENAIEPARGFNVLVRFAGEAVSSFDDRLLLVPVSAFDLFAAMFARSSAVLSSTWAAAGFGVSKKCRASAGRLGVPTTVLVGMVLFAFARILSFLFVVIRNESSSSSDIFQYRMLAVAVVVIATVFSTPNDSKCFVVPLAPIAFFTTEIVPELTFRRFAGLSSHVIANEPLESSVGHEFSELVFLVEGLGVEKFVTDLRGGGGGESSIRIGDAMESIGKYGGGLGSIVVFVG